MHHRSTFISSLKISFFLWVALYFLLACQPALDENRSTPEFSRTPISTLTPPITQTSVSTDIPEATSTSRPTPLPPSATPLPSATQRATLEPGATKVSERDGMVLHYVPAGEFWMGSSPQSAAADYDEMPQHVVYLDAFWIDQSEVTNAMFAQFLNEMGNQVEGRATWLDAGDGDALLVQIDGLWRAKAGAEDLPAVEVTWYGAQAYCAWAGRRLPTEAEWEKAARGTDGRSFPWGEEQDCAKAQVANCNSSLAGVGSKPGGGSPYGALDMAGNVWEWVADWYAEDYYAQSPARNPHGPMEGEARSLRGGSYDYNWKHARAANRRLNGPASSMNDYGFRCALSEGVYDDE